MNVSGPLRTVDVEGLASPAHGAVQVLSAALAEKVCIVSRRANRHRFGGTAEEVTKIVSLT